MTEKDYHETIFKLMPISIDNKEEHKSFKTDVNNLTIYDTLKNSINIETLYCLIQDIKVTTNLIFENMFRFEINDEILVRLEQFKADNYYLPFYIIERTIAAMLQQSFIVIYADNNVIAFNSNGTIEKFYSIHSNTLCSIIEDNNPQIFKNVNKQFIKFTLKDYITERECSSCQDSCNYKTQILIPCFHTICSKCVVNWISINKSCPICRKHITQINTIDSEELLCMTRNELGIVVKKIPNRMY